VGSAAYNSKKEESKQWNWNFLRLVKQYTFYDHKNEEIKCGTLRGHLDGFGGLVVSILATGTRVCGFKGFGFFGHPENPQYAFLRRGSKIICPMSQLCGM
jgi:hypothetical protein